MNLAPTIGNTIFQAAAEAHGQARRPLVRCGWHAKFNNGATLVMQDGDPLQVSDGLCPSCEAVMMKEVESMKVKR